MPFINTDGKGDWQYRNCAMSKYSNPDYTFELPNEFVNAKERYIVVRQCRCLFGRTDTPFDSETNDVLLLSDFVQECYLASDEIDKAFNVKSNRLGYVMICNDANAKKKRYQYVWSNKVFRIGFTNAYGAPVLPTTWIFDFLLAFR